MSRSAPTVLVEASATNGSRNGWTSVVYSVSSSPVSVPSIVVRMASMSTNVTPMASSPMRPTASLERRVRGERRAGVGIEHVLDEVRARADDDHVAGDRERELEGPVGDPEAVRGAARQAAGHAAERGEVDADGRDRGVAVGLVAGATGRWCPPPSEMKVLRVPNRFDGLVRIRRDDDEARLELGAGRVDDEARVADPAEDLVHAAEQAGRAFDRLERVLEAGFVAELLERAEPGRTDLVAGHEDRSGRRDVLDDLVDAVGRRPEVAVDVRAWSATPSRASDSTRSW